MSDTICFWGMDRMDYPGDDVMADLWNYSNLHWTGFYLGPTPNHPQTDWMTHRSALISRNWKVAPIYVGRQHGSSYFNQGAAEAQNAASYASSAGFPQGSFIYLDVEYTDYIGQQADFMNYILSWAKEVAQNTSYYPGIYCSKGNAADIINLINGSSEVSRIRYWIANYLPTTPDLTSLDTLTPESASGFTEANICQCKGDTVYNIAGHTLSIDVSTSEISDPSI